MRKLLLLATLALGCAGADDGTDGAAADSAAANATPAEATLVATIDSLSTPESMVHDPAQDVYFISNIVGNGGAADNDGFITRVRSDGTVDQLRFIASGQNGVTLNAPKGLAMSGNVLWVTDIDHVRSFDATTGAPLASHAVPDAIFLNDIIVGPGDTLLVTDSRLVFAADGTMTDEGAYRIYQVAPDGTASIALATAALTRPNGLLRDGNRILIAPLSATDIFAWTPGDTTLTSVATGPGSYDGIVAGGNGTFIVSTIGANQIGRVANGTFTPIVNDIVFPADIGYDVGRNRVLVPLLQDNRAQIWQLPAGN